MTKLSALWTIPIKNHLLKEASPTANGTTRLTHIKTTLSASNEPKPLPIPTAPDVPPPDSWLVIHFPCREVWTCPTRANNPSSCMMCPRHHQHVVDHSSLAGCRASRCDCRNKSPAKQDWHTCPLANNPSRDDCRSKSLAKQDWHTCPLANNPSSSMMCLRHHQWRTTVAVLPQGTIVEAKAWRSKIDTHAQHWLTIPHGTTMVDHSCRTASRDDCRSKSLAEQQDWHTCPLANNPSRDDNGGPQLPYCLTGRLPKQKPGGARLTHMPIG
jgi:hypothetical protein